MANVRFSYMLCSIFLLSGCATAQIATPKAVVLQKDQIYTVPAGKPVDLVLDKKPVTVTFPEDMKVTSIDHLLTQERKLNDAVLDKSKADKNRNKWIGILGSALAVLAGAFGAFWKSKGGINLKTEVKA